MFIFIIGGTAGILGLTLLIGACRRHRARPPIHQVLMAEHLWQPRKLD